MSYQSQNTANRPFARRKDSISRKIILRPVIREIIKLRFKEDRKEDEENDRSNWK